MGKPNDLVEWHLRTTFTVEDTTKIFNNVAKVGIRVIDHLVACSNLALDEWNEARNTPPGTIANVVTVNMRGRFGGQDERNYSSTIFIRSNPRDRIDTAQFARDVAVARKKQLTRQMDLMVSKSISMGAAFFTLFSFGIRQKAAHYFMKSQRFSVAVGFMGVVWPDLKDGRFGEDSMLQKAGEFEIIDVHGTGTSLQETLKSISIVTSTAGASHWSWECQHRYLPAKKFRHSWNCSDGK